MSIRRICIFISKYFAAIVVVVAAVSLFLPWTFNWISTSWITPMLGFIMFGMGLTLDPHDFKVVLLRPRDIFVGSAAQFIIMPLIAFVLSRMFGLSDELAVGVILVGCCPGGTASNVMTFLAKGDLVLSVGMTTVSTVLAPFMTPLLMLLYAGERIQVDALGMFLSIIEVVILPIIAGLAVQKLSPGFTKKAAASLPALSSIMITLIVGSVVSANAAKLLVGGVLIVAVVMLHNVCGLALGYGISRLLSLPHSKCSAISIEVGMQNSGLASSLAAVHFAMYPMATVPGAIFSVWHNISGALIAKLYAWQQDKIERTKL